MNIRQIWQDKLEIAIDDFNHRRISDDVFRAQLRSAGFVGARLIEEYNFHSLLRHDIEKHKTLDGRVSVS